MSVTSQLDSAMQAMNATAGSSSLSNAQALALLDAFGSPPLDGPDIDATQPQLWTLRWLAHGYSHNGDLFAGAKNAAHYAAPYADPGALLLALVDAADRSDRYLAATGAAEPTFQVDPDLAAGKEAALAHALAISWQVMQAARDAKVARTGKPRTGNPIVDGDLDAIDILKGVLAWLGGKLGKVLPIIRDPLGVGAFTAAMKFAGVLLLLYHLDRR